ncbi:unnamed protein product [Closterium sp. Naga37s-1]|nr:unnamed protein product [Closterium sp. Naga37s-1]
MSKFHAVKPLPFLPLHLSSHISPSLSPHLPVSPALSSFAHCSPVYPSSPLPPLLVPTFHLPSPLTPHLPPSLLWLEREAARAILLGVTSTGHPSWSNQVYPLEPLPPPHSSPTCLPSPLTPHLPPSLLWLEREAARAILLGVTELGAARDLGGVIEGHS